MVLRSIPAHEIDFEKINGLTGLQNPAKAADDKKPNKMTTEQKIRNGQSVELPKMKSGTFLVKGEIFEGILAGLYFSEDGGKTWKHAQMIMKISHYLAQFD